MEAGGRPVYKQAGPDRWLFYKNKQGGGSWGTGWHLGYQSYSEHVNDTALYPSSITAMWAGDQVVTCLDVAAIVREGESSCHFTCHCAVLTTCLARQLLARWC
jgi:hypothetical protein